MHSLIPIYIINIHSLHLYSAAWYTKHYTDFSSRTRPIDFHINEFIQHCNQQLTSCFRPQCLIDQIQVQKIILIVATNQMLDNSINLLFGHLSSWASEVEYFEIFSCLQENQLTQRFFAKFNLLLFFLIS